MNKKSILIGALICLVLFSGLALVSRSLAKPIAADRSNSLLVITEDNFDFGSVSMAKGKVQHEYKIKNNGSRSVIVTKLFTSCMCTEASIITKDGSAGPFGMPGHGFIPSISRSIAPGEEAVIKAVFDPAAHGPAGIGPVSRVITVETEGDSPINLAFQALVTP